MWYALIFWAIWVCIEISSQPMVFLQELAKKEGSKEFKQKVMCIHYYNSLKHYSHVNDLLVCHIANLIKK